MSRRRRTFVNRRKGRGRLEMDGGPEETVYLGKRKVGVKLAQWKMVRNGIVYLENIYRKWGE